MATITEVQKFIEQKTGLKITAKKNVGSMKHYITFKAVKEKGQRHRPELPKSIGKDIYEVFGVFTLGGGFYDVCVKELVDDRGEGVK